MRKTRFEVVKVPARPNRYVRGLGVAALNGKSPRFV
jgi:hypothetical protein